MTGILLVIPIACTIIVTSVRPYKWKVYVPTNEKCTSLQMKSVRPYKSQVYISTSDKCTSLQVTSVHSYKWQVYVPTREKCMFVQVESVCPYKWQVYVPIQVTSVRPYTSDKCTSLQSQIANVSLVELHHWVSWQWKLTHYRMWLLVRSSDVRTSACTGIYSDMKWVRMLKCTYSLNLFMIPWQPLTISVNQSLVNQCIYD